MPIYAYKCSSCQFEQDVLQKISDEPLHVCPHCGAETFAKQLTAAGFQLKGSGWYATDFKGGAGRVVQAGEGRRQGSGAVRRRRVSGLSGRISGVLRFPDARVRPRQDLPGRDGGCAPADAVSAGTGLCMAPAGTPDARTC